MYVAKGDTGNIIETSKDFAKLVELIEWVNCIIWYVDPIGETFVCVNYK